jgi:UDP-N-acetylmuramoyl-tripeptide--D-alanyl-D-alanine ligase
VAVLSLGAVAEATGGTVVSGDPALRVDRYAIDSRAVRGGELFFALVGARNDGHRFLDEAYRRGAAAAVISEPKPAPGPAVRVGDTTAALRALGRRVRRDWGGTVIGITGSCGKTTTKEMLRLALSCTRRVLATTGNLNNLFGLPLVLLDLLPEHDVAVLEMGISTPGEMGPLAAIAGPDVGVILNVAAVHLVHFASVREIAEAKGALFTALGPNGTAVFNADDPLVAGLAARHSGPKLSFGLGGPADVGAFEIEEHGPDGISARLRSGDQVAALDLPVGGRHNLMNALAAVAAARAVGVPLAESAPRLAGFHPVSMRGVRTRLARGLTVWDESYNSNPAAMRAVLRTFASARPAGRRVLVSGDMLEIGTGERREHESLAAVVADAGVGLFVGVGPLSALTAGRLRERPDMAVVSCADAREAAAALPALVRDGDLVLVKGSRGIGLDAVVKALIAARGGAS